MKKTILFSNIIWQEKDSRFNNYMEEYLKENVKQHSNLVFINAPGIGEDETYLSIITSCFKNINITFDNILDVEFNTQKEYIEDFIKEKENIVYFLMGGNPLTQYDIILQNNLAEIIKEYEGIVIGFCAGAINLSKYSIITTDEDFKENCSYKGIGRVELIIEPHYNVDEKNMKELNTRNDEIIKFAKKYDMNIYAIPDESMIVVENDNVIKFGKIYNFKNY